MAESVTTAADVGRLAIGLLSAERDAPWAVVTAPSTARDPSIDVEDLDAAIGDVVPVFVIRDPRLTWQLSELLPDRCQVYGDAARVYPVGTQWQTDPARSPLRVVRARTSVPALMDAVQSDAFAMANAAGLFAAPPAAQVRAVTGRIAGVVVPGERAFVTLDHGGVAVLHRDLIAPGVPLEWSVHPGQVVSGALDPESNRLLPTVATPTSDSLRRRFPPGSVTSALISDVTADGAVAALHPGVRLPLPLSAVTGNPLDRLDFLLSDGEVVAVRVAYTEDGVVAVSMLDVDDDEQVLEALALLEGGRPWLEPLRNVPDPVDPADRRDAASDPGALPPEDVPAAAEVPPPTTSGTDTASPTPPPTPGPRPGPRPRPGPHTAVTTPRPAASEPGTAAGPADEAPAPRSPARDPEERSSAVDAGPTGSRRRALQSTQVALAAARAENARLRARLESALVPTAPPPTIPVVPVPAAAPPAGAGIEASVLHREIDDLVAEAEDLRRDLTRARTMMQQLRTQLREAKRLASLTSTAEEAIVFSDDDEWVRHSIRTVWMQRFTPADRLEWPLSEFVIGPDFSDSVRSSAAALHPKIWRCAVDAVTGRWRTSPVRAAHPLRAGSGGTAPDVVRPGDGARCHRLSVEKRAAGARRMHIWVLPDGRIELSRVVVHDDVTP